MNLQELIDRTTITHSSDIMSEKLRGKSAYIYYIKMVSKDITFPLYKLGFTTKTVDERIGNMLKGRKVNY